MRKFLIGVLIGVAIYIGRVLFAPSSNIDDLSLAEQAEVVRDIIGELIEEV